MRLHVFGPGLASGVKSTVTSRSATPFVNRVLSTSRYMKTIETIASRRRWSCWFVVIAWDDVRT